MTQVNQPQMDVVLSGANPSGPSGETTIIQALPPLPPSVWAPLVRGLNSGDAVADFRDVGSDNTNFVAVADEGFAARSQNGVLWSVLPQGLNSGLVTAGFKAVTGAPDGTMIAAATGGWAARSLDGGATWSALVQGLGAASNSDFNRIATDGAGNWLAVASNGNNGFSTDNGDTWNNGGAIGGLGSVDYEGVTHFGPPGTFLVSTENGGAGITTDSGATYTSFLTPQGLNSGDVSADFMDTASQGAIIVVSGAGEEGAISPDQGANWVAAPSFLNSGNSGVQSFGALEADGFNNFFSVQENGWTALSIDVGTTWNASIQGLNSGSTGADFKGVVTNKKGIWIAVALQGWASIGTE